MPPWLDASAGCRVRRCWCVQAATRPSSTRRRTRAQAAGRLSSASCRRGTPTCCSRRDPSLVTARAWTPEQEVVVYEALRTALPDTSIEPHVRLTGRGPSRLYTDLLVGRAVYVEVLMVGSDHVGEDVVRRCYRDQWSRKLAFYRDELGVEPITFEPLDVVDPIRLRGKVEEVRRALGRGEPPGGDANAPGAGPEAHNPARRPLGWWQDDANARGVLREVCERLGRCPTALELNQAGARGIWAWLSRNGGLRAAAAALGFARSVPTRITERRRAMAARVEHELMDMWERDGRLPTTYELRASGHWATWYLSKPGMLKHFRERLAARLGRPIRAPTRPSGTGTRPRTCSASFGRSQSGMGACRSGPNWSGQLARRASRTRSSAWVACRQFVIVSRLTSQ